MCWRDINLNYIFPISLHTPPANKSVASILEDNFKSNLISTADILILKEIWTQPKNNHKSFLQVSNKLLQIILSWSRQRWPVTRELCHETISMEAICSSHNKWFCVSDDSLSVKPNEATTHYHCCSLTLKKCKTTFESFENYNPMIFLWNYWLVAIFIKFLQLQSILGGTSKYINFKIKLV